MSRLLESLPTINRFDVADRRELEAVYAQYRTYSDEVLRRAILERDRIDLLCTEILGLEVQPCHLAMLQFQIAKKDTLILAWRGGGKTQVSTIAKCISYLAHDRNLRILLVSKTRTNAIAFLREVKKHLAENERLIEVFGPFYDNQRSEKWDEGEIEVLGRTRVMKEASITCAGVDSMVVGKHYDVLIADDLVDEETSRTKHMREKLKLWYYQSLCPTLEPQDAKVRFRGERHRQGSRYNPYDLYGYWIENELKDRHLIIPVVDEFDRSAWPMKFTPSWVQTTREELGTIVWSAQMLCNTEPMKGEIFRWEDIQLVDPSEIPGDLKIYDGADLAIADGELHDEFALCRIGILGDFHKDPTIFVLHAYSGQLRFGRQTERLNEEYDSADPIWMAIEKNAYQAAQLDHLKEKRPTMRLLPVHTSKDKLTRALTRSALFEQKRVFIRKGLPPAFIDQLVMFPNAKRDDLFDAFDLALTAAASTAKVRKRRARTEPGLL